MLVTKMAKTVANIVYLSETHSVSNTSHQHRCNRYSGPDTIEFTDEDLNEGILFSNEYYGAILTYQEGINLTIACR